MLPQAKVLSAKALKIKNAMQSLPTIWSIIINWKCAEETCACLASLVPTVDPATVIVIDNGSADGSVETICARFPDVVMLAQNDNLGFAKAANIGIAHALAAGAAGILPCAGRWRRAAGGLEEKKCHGGTRVACERGREDSRARGSMANG